MKYSNDKKIYNTVVIGSGHASTAAVSFLLKKNIKPLVLDACIDSHQNTSKFHSAISYLNLGGLSNIWGGFINKIHKKEMKNWPIKYNNLNFYYKSINHLFKETGEDDEYSKYFNLNKIDKISSSKIKKILSYFVGFPRSMKNLDGNIFNSKFFFSKLIKKKKILIKKNFYVKKVAETEKNVVIYSYDKKKIFCKKLYIGAGAIETSKIMLNSFPKIKKVKLKETSLITSFFFSIKKKKFLKSINGCTNYLTSLTPFKEHIQLYVLNQEFIDRLNRLKGSKNKFSFINFFSKIFFGRIFFTFSYLDQNKSSYMNISLKNKEFVFTNFERKHFFHNKNIFLISKLLNTKLFKIFALKKKFGFGNHFGSSFPMKHRPKNYEADILGRINNLKNIHIIDSSVLTTLPISTITYTVMANSARIIDNSIKK